MVGLCACPQYGQIDDKWTCKLRLKHEAVTRDRTVLALFLSPVLVPAAVFLLALADGIPLKESLVVAAVYAVFTYSAAFLLGLPAHLALRRAACTAFWHYAAAGAAIGVTILTTLVLFNEHVRLSLGPVVVFTGCGIASGTSFWVMMFGWSSWPSDREQRRFRGTRRS
jgi:hypothetical protein